MGLIIGPMGPMGLIGPIIGLIGLMGPIGLLVAAAAAGFVGAPSEMCIAGGSVRESAGLEEDATEFGVGHQAGVFVLFRTATGFAEPCLL